MRHSISNNRSEATTVTLSGWQLPPMLATWSEDVPASGGIADALLELPQVTIVFVKPK